MSEEITKLLDEMVLNIEESDCHPDFAVMDLEYLQGHVKKAYEQGRVDERKRLLGDQKPDAYIAWHFEQGFCYDAFAAVPNHECFDGMASGWQIKPVKLVVLDE